VKQFNEDKYYFENGVAKYRFLSSPFGEEYVYTFLSEGFEEKNFT
jgi:hypothetical protein